MATGQVSLSDIECELRAQVRKVIRAGIRPTHFDGHKHIHVLPPVSEVVIRLAREFRIPAVRCPMEQTSHASVSLRNHVFSRISSVKQYLISRTVSDQARNFRKKLERAGLLSPNYFYGLSQTGFLDARAIREILQDLPPGTSELMCHPGYRDIDLERTGTRLLTQRETEIQGLTAPSVKSLVVSGAIKLSNYKELFELIQRTDVAA